MHETNASLTRLIMLHSFIDDLTLDEAQLVFSRLALKVSRQQVMAALNLHVEDELNRAHLRMQQLDLGFRSALALVPPQRMTSQLKRLLGDLVVQAIDPQQQCKLERDFVERHQDNL